MKAVVQRVREARVSVGEELVGEIRAGLFVLVGVAREDEAQDVAWLVDKVSGLRVLSDAEGRLNRSVLEAQAELLVVSQFTLLADTRRGRRPGFDGAMRPPAAEALYEQVLRGLRALGLSVASGRFGADMTLQVQLDGPVTILLDSRAKG